MSGTLPAKELLLDSVDDYLGPGEKRFFGSGFRRVRYRYDKAELTGGPGAPTELSSRLDVVYPADWSRKATARGDLRPHLSTVDGLIIAVHLSEAALTHSLGLGPESRRAGRVLSVRIKAGTEPDEELTGLPVRTTVLGEPVRGGEGEAVSRLQTLVGAMRVRTDLRHPLPTPPPGTPVATAAYTGPAELLGPVERQYYGTGFTARTQSVRKVAVRAAEARARAVVDVAQEPGTALATEGFEGLYQPFVGLIDTFVTSLQLGQILLYETDGISRGASNTLWMRTTVLRASAEPDPIRYETPLDVRLENSTLLRRENETWRAADIVGRLAGNTVRCSVAHRLPG